MASTTSILIFLVLFFLWYCFYWRLRRKIWAAGRLIPGPDLLPVINSSYVFFVEIGKVLPRLMELTKKFGSVVRIWIPGKMMVLLVDPEDIKCVLRNPKFVNRDFFLSKLLKPFFGNGLFTSKDEVWKMHRRLMNPMFHHKVLESYHEIFGLKAKILADELDKMADGKPFDVNEKICLCSLDAVCENVIGLATSTTDPGYSEYWKVNYSITRALHRSVLFPWLAVPWLHSFTSNGRKARAVKEGLDEFNNDLIARKIAAYRQGIRHPGVVTGSGKIVTSFLDVLIEASETQGSHLTEQEIHDEVSTMTSVALSTTSVTMSALLLLIAIHSEWQDALFAEMRDVFADDMSRAATIQDLPKMPVLDRVLRETMRMYPVAPLLNREISEDVVLPSGYTLPAGCSVLVVNYIVHRDAKNYPDPDKFLPDRWLPGSGINTHYYAYLPFVGGARHCIAQKYSLFQMKSTISLLVRRFKMATDLTMVDLEKLEMSFILRLRSGSYQLKLEKRGA